MLHVYQRISAIQVRREAQPGIQGLGITGKEGDPAQVLRLGRHGIAARA